MGKLPRIICYICTNKTTIMIKKIYAFLAVTLLLFLFSCTKESVSISIYQDQEIVPFSGSTVNVVVTSDLSWILEGEYDWCTADVKTGTGNGAIIFTIKRNTTYSERTATFNVVATDGGSQVVKIQQEQNDALLVSQENVYLDAAEQSYTVEISANVDYTIEGPSKDWISVTESKSKALSKKTLTIKVDGNSGSLREASIGLKCKVDGMSTAIKVLQACEGAVIKYKTKSGKVYPDVNGSVSSSDPPTQTIYTKAKRIANVYQNGQGMILYDIALDATPRYLLMGADIAHTHFWIVDI